jgi:phosphoglycerate dehydrogenase-like enzyme
MLRCIMRIHIQNPNDDPLFLFSHEQWDAAAARAGDIARGHEVTLGITDDDFAAGMEDAEALVTELGVMLRMFPCRAPRLRLIYVTSAGLEKLAPYDWLPSNVTLLNNSGTHSQKAGEFGIMSVLMLAGGVPQLVTNQRAGTWTKHWGTTVAGKRVTVVGLGGMGAPIAGWARKFGMHVTGVRATATPHPDCDEVITTAEIDRVLPTTNYLALACPLTPATRGLMDRRRLGLLPPGAGLMNIGRGGLLDQDALCDLLDSGHLSGAVLDVFTPEPLPDGHRLWTTPNVIISPHTSVDEPATYNALSLDLFFENLRALRDGKPMPNVYDTTRGY